MTNSTVSTTPRQRTAIRRLCGVERNTSVTVHVIPGGRLTPRLLGEGDHWTTPGGKPFYHPNAYRRAWGLC